MFPDPSTDKQIYEVNLLTFIRRFYIIKKEGMHNRIKLHAFFLKNNERKGKSMIVQLIENIYQFLWGENGFMFRYQEVEAWDFRCSLYCCFQRGIVFTIKTKFLPIRLFPDMVKALTANNKNGKDEKKAVFLLYRP